MTPQRAMKYLKPLGLYVLTVITCLLTNEVESFSSNQFWGMMEQNSMLIPLALARAVKVQSSHQAFASADLTLSVKKDFRKAIEPPQRKREGLEKTDSKPRVQNPERMAFLSVRLTGNGQGIL